MDPSEKERARAATRSSIGLPAPASLNLGITALTSLDSRFVKTVLLVLPLRKARSVRSITDNLQLSACVRGNGPWRDDLSMRVAAERIKHALLFLFGRVFIKRHVWREISWRD